MIRRLVRWVFRFRLRREIDEELQFHIDMRRTEFRNAGMSRQAADAAALTRFGQIDEVRDQSTVSVNYPTNAKRG